ncbi:MAG: AAA family ATPase, partial [Terriglobia bacterium]
IRVAHFDIALGLCTLEAAKEAAERRYSNRETFPPLFGREQEISTLKAFLDDPKVRVIVVSGPQGVGKTRIVAEALSPMPERVVWARDIPAQTVGLMQVLDESFHPAVLVVDDAEAQPEVVLRKALEAARLKTIIVCSWGSVAPGALSLSIKPFTDSESDKLLTQVFPEIPYAHRGWLYDNFGGYPGLLLQAAAAFRSEVGPDSRQEPTYEAILQAYEERMLKGFGPIADVLEPLSVLPTFRVSTDADADLRLLCDVLQVDLAKVRKNIASLKARDLIRPVGFRDDGHFQVTPPLLARRIAQRVIVGISDRLSTLHKQLSPDGRAGLIRRVAELQDEPSVRGFLSQLFSSSGLFQDLQSVVINAAAVRALAETLPTPTARELRSVLEGKTLDERRAVLSEVGEWPVGKKRGALVSALV